MKKLIFIGILLSIKLANPPAQGNSQTVALSEPGQAMDILDINESMRLTFIDNVSSIDRWPVSSFDRPNRLQPLKVYRESSSSNENSCEMSAISGLWPDGQGGFIGSSKVEWKNCPDGNHYIATCAHEGSGTNMKTCTCEVSNGQSQTYERTCQGLVTSSSLFEASVQCCGFFQS